MGQNIRCLECNKLYSVMIENVKIVGPILTTKCPFCKNMKQQNFSTFVYEQIKKGEGLATIKDAVQMHKLANNIEKIIFNI